MAGWDPEDYSRSSRMQQQQAELLLERVDLAGAAAILDLGCGDGKITAAVAERAPHGRVVGLDADAGMIALARRRWGDRPNLTFVQQSALDMSFEAEFDWALSFCCIHWIHDHRALYRRVARALKPGGRVLFQAGGRGNIDDIMPYFRAACRQPGYGAVPLDDPWPWFFNDADDERACAEAAGLRVERCEVVPRPFAHPGVEALAAWFRTTWHPYLTNLDAAAAGRLCLTAAEAFAAARPPGPDGLLRVTMQRLEVEAVKPEDAVDE